MALNAVARASAYVAEVLWATVTDKALDLIEDNVFGFKVCEIFSLSELTL